MGNGRIKKTAILLSTALLVTGCSGGNTAVEELSADTAFYTYPVGNAVTFDVSGDGTVYTIESENGDLLCSYTLSGERSEIAELPQKLTALRSRTEEYTTPRPLMTERRYAISMFQRLIPKSCACFPDCGR